MDDTITVWVPLQAVAKQRPRLTRKRRGGRNIAYTPQATRNFEVQVADIVRSAIPEGFHFGSKPVCVTVEIHKTGFSLQIEPAESSVRPVGIRGDIDNITKAIFDGLNGVVWDDDRQVELMSVGFVGVPRKGTQYGG
jgi:Holliday junction resolvase RusA-like endonuclease